MEQLRTKPDFVRTAITKTIATLSTLLKHPATPTGMLENHLTFLKQKHSELIAFDNDMQATLFETDLGANMATSLEYQQRVIFTISDVRCSFQSRPPTIPVSFAYTAKPLIARLPLSPQHAPIRVSPYLLTPAPASSCVVQPTVPRHADVTSSTSSDAIPKKLKPAELCAVPLNSSTFAQPAILDSNDDAALLNTCMMSTVQEPTPAGRSLLPIVPAAVTTAVLPSPTSLTEVAPSSISSFASCVQRSELTFAALPSKMTKDGEKKRAPPSSGFSKHSARSHSSTSKRPTSISRNDKTSSTTSLWEQ